MKGDSLCPKGSMKILEKWYWFSDKQQAMNFEVWMSVVSILSSQANVSKDQSAVLRGNNLTIPSDG